MFFSLNIKYIKTENTKFTIIPLYPLKSPLNQVSILTSKINVKITDENLEKIKANNVSNIKETFLFLKNNTIAENIIPSKIKKYKVGGIGILVSK